MASDWEIIQGKKPILLVASHNYSHIRDEKLKLGDIGTGNIVRILCKNLDCFGVLTTKIMDDPNWYTNSNFRNEVKQIIKDSKIKVVLDVHGRKQDSDDLIELYPNETFKSGYEDQLREYLVKKLLDNDQLTLTEDLDNEKIPGVEIEIRKDGRLSSNKEQFSAVIQKLSSLITNL